MTPTQALLDAWAVLLAEDPATLAPASSGNKVTLIAANFNPLTVTTLASLTAATFTGSTPLVAGTGPQQEFVDPATQLRQIQLLEPAGGWHWQCTAAPTSPELIYGYAVAKNDGSELYGTAKFPTPISIQAVGEAIDISQVRFTMVAAPLS